MHRKNVTTSILQAQDNVHFIELKITKFETEQKKYLLLWYGNDASLSNVLFWSNNKGQVSLASRENWLSLKRNNPKLRVKFSTFTLNTICLVEKRPFVLKINTNSPFIKTKRRHMHRYSRIATSFQRVAHLEWKCFNASTFLSVYWKSKKTRKKVFWYLWRWTTEAWLCTPIIPTRTV